MTDREKVIKGLERCLICDTSVVALEEAQNAYLECEYTVGRYCGQKELLLDALSLLKEQEAKQVIRKQCKKEYDDGSIECFAEWYCPHCNSLILRGFDNPSIKFCYKCGKPILWEGR